MATPKKSLSVPELVAKIKSYKSLSSKQLMAELRKQFSFSKDKWNQARKMLSSKAPVKTCSSKKTSGAKPAAKKDVACYAPPSNIYTEVFQAMNVVEKISENIVVDVIKFCKTHPSNGLAQLDICPTDHPSLFRLLDKAVEAGLLREVHGYMLGDAFVDEHAESHKKPSKKKK